MENMCVLNLHLNVVVYVHDLREEGSLYQIVVAVVVGWLW